MPVPPAAVPELATQQPPAAGMAGSPPGMGMMYLPPPMLHPAHSGEYMPHAGGRLQRAGGSAASLSSLLTHAPQAARRRPTRAPAALPHCTPPARRFQHAAAAGVRAAHGGSVAIAGAVGGGSAAAAAGPAGAAGARQQWLWPVRGPSVGAHRSLAPCRRSVQPRRGAQVPAGRQGCQAALRRGVRCGSCHLQCCL